MECLPLVMEPESSFYADPVVVLDFQSLYPSMIIAYNLCYSTCLGNIAPSKANILGVTEYSPDPDILQKLKDQILLTPNGVLYVQSKVLLPISFSFLFESIAAARQSPRIFYATGAQVDFPQTLTVFSLSLSLSLSLSCCPVIKFRKCLCSMNPA